MNDLDSFLEGYRPGVLYNPSHQKKEIQHLVKYPYVAVEVHQIQQHLFLQSSHLRDVFERKTSGFTPNSLVLHKEIGLALGFPPQAVDFYIESLLYPELESQKINVSYCGIGFITGIKSLVTDVLWLWKLNIPMKNRTHTLIGYSCGQQFFKKGIPTHDITKLQEIEREIKKLAIYAS